MPRDYAKRNDENMLRLPAETVLTVTIGASLLGRILGGHFLILTAYIQHLNASPSIFTLL